MMSAKRLALKTGGGRIAGVKLFVLRQVTSNQLALKLAPHCQMPCLTRDAGAPAAGEASEIRGDAILLLALSHGA